MESKSGGAHQGGREAAQRAGAGGGGPVLARTAAMFDELAAGYDADGVHERVAAALVAFMDLPAGGGLVVDVAAGTGAGALAVVRAGGGWRVLAVDVSARMLTVGRARAAETDPDGRVGWVRAAGLALPVADGAVDAVVCASSAHFLGVAALGQWRRVLRAGGRLGFTVPAAAGFDPSPAMRQVMPTGVAALPGEVGALVAATERADFARVRAREIDLPGAPHRQVVLLAATRA